MKEKITLGQRGEDLACEFLKKKGYEILARNYRKPWGEIDIVTRAGDGTLVFIEVKTMAGAGASFAQVTEGKEELLNPEDHANEPKMKKVRKTCEALVNRNPKLVSEKRGWRIDLVAIVIRDSDPVIRHYESV